MGFQCAFQKAVVKCAQSVQGNEVMDRAIQLLHEIQRLMELRGENLFKIRAFEKAAQQLEGRTDLLERAQSKTLREIPGIGKGIEEILSEFLLEGRSSVLDELKKAIPQGLLELTQIPGLGPKKALTLIEELGVRTIGELEYACKENRLIGLKGFGLKAQQKILENVSFFQAHQGQQKLSEAWPLAEKFYQEIKQEYPELQLSETGELRRKLEVLSHLEFLVVESEEGKVKRDALETFIEGFRKRNEHSLPIVLHFCSAQEFGYWLAQTTASQAHWEELGAPASSRAQSEEEFYRGLGLSWIAPELRETGEEVEWARKGTLEQILPWDSIRGVFHAHTLRSDGAASLEEMVQAALKQGFEYIGISDHSQSAYYAQGLKVPDLWSQREEVEKIQKKYPQIKVFWGIESDILQDGSLDYEPEVLKAFDFVIASIHSRFQMDRAAMTERVLKAIRNPYTRFLGHPTGRLLLGRKGYELDFEAVIQEAHQYGVAIELNSNPNRLDLDWRWGQVMRKHQTLTSINPDAHDVEGIADTRFGIAMARKALFSKHQVINTQSAQEVEKWLKRK